MASFDLKVGDRVIRVRGTKIESIGEEARLREDVAPVGNRSYPSDNTESAVRTVSAEPVSINVGTASALEDEATLTFALQLSRPADEEIVLAFRTIDGTATADTDFEEQSGIMLIERGVHHGPARHAPDQRSAKGERGVLLARPETSSPMIPSIANVPQSPILARIQDDD